MARQAEQEKVFVVVDPADEVHVALERAIVTALLRDPLPKLFVFVGVDRESVDTRVVNDNLFRDAHWFEEQIRKPIEEKGLQYEVEVSWCSEWQKSIMQSASRFGASVILLPVHAQRNQSRFTFSESKWKLLKNAFCPVILIRSSGKEERKVILAAVNFQATHDAQVALNESILTRGQWLANSYNADFHVVNAYLDSMHYPDRGKLVHSTGLSSDRLHVRQGYTNEVISSVARQVGADVVVLGTLGQSSGISKPRRGNTAERVIAALDTDVIVINTELE